MRRGVEEMTESPVRNAPTWPRPVSARREVPRSTVEALKDYPPPPPEQRARAKEVCRLACQFVEDMGGSLNFVVPSEFFDTRIIDGTTHVGVEVMVLLEEDVARWKDLFESLFIPAISKAKPHVEVRVRQAPVYVAGGAPMKRRSVWRRLLTW